MQNSVQYTEILEYCLSKNGAFVDYPFGPDYITVKIRNGDKCKIFAEIFMLNDEWKLTFSTDEQTALYLRATYPQITRGWHCPPVQAKYKSTVSINDLPNEILFQLMDISYERATIKRK